MPAVCEAHHLGNPEARDRLCNAVRGFFADFPGAWKIGFIGSQANTVWQMSVESPSGAKWSRDLFGENGEHELEIILKYIKEIVDTAQNDDQLEKLGRIADMKFKLRTDGLYESPIRETKNLVDQHANEGIASTGKFLRKVADSVEEKFQTIEQIFKDTYVDPFANAALSEGSESWLRRKIDNVVEHEVGRAQDVTQKLCSSFAGATPGSYSAFVAHVQGTGKTIQQRLNDAVNLLILETETSPKKKSSTTMAKGEVSETPVAFISYSWDSEAHKKWVLDLASRLQAHGGVRIILDRWHLPPGGDKTVFMEKSVGNSTFVILICTPDYAGKANSRRGGVGYEAMIITGELARNIHQRKFIPVLREGDWDSSLPVWINTKIGVNLKGDPYSEREYEDLLRALHNEPLTPPAIGPKPLFERTAIHDPESPREASQEASKRAPVRFFNFDGTPEPISVSGRQHSAQDSSQVDLWGVVTIVNYTHSPVKIAPLQLFLSGAEWPFKKVFFREKSNPRDKFERISLVGNQKEHYELHFMFSVANCPQARSGYLVLLVETDRGEESVQIGVRFP